MVGSPSSGDGRPSPFVQRLAEEIRERRKVAGLSQPALAALIGYTRQYVSLAERPKRGVASAELVRAIDDALDAGGALVALRRQAAAERKRCGSATFPSDTAVAVRATSVTDVSGVNSEGGVKRRELLRLLSMVEVLVTVPGTDDQLDPLDCSSKNSGRLDDLAVGQYATLNENIWRVFVLSKSKGVVLPLVRSQLDVLIGSLNQSQGLATHQRLCALASELLQLAGEIFFDANKYTDAAHCYTLAATASKEADAFDLWACAMTRHAFIEMYERRFERVMPMLELAARLARRGRESLSTGYWVAAVQAQAFAGLGELDACRRALDVAERVHELSGDVSNGGWLRFDGSRLAEERGACYVELRRPDLAENTLHDALRQNLSARRRGSVLTDLAMIGVQRGDVDQLVAYGDAALEVVAQTGSGFVSRKLQGLQGHLAPLLGNSDVRQLNQQITTLSGKSSS